MLPLCSFVGGKQGRQTCSIIHTGPPASLTNKIGAFKLFCTWREHDGRLSNSEPGCFIFLTSGSYRRDVTSSHCVLYNPPGKVNNIFLMSATSLGSEWLSPKRHHHLSFWRICYRFLSVCNTPGTSGSRLDEREWQKGQGGKHTHQPQQG